MSKGTQAQMTIVGRLGRDPEKKTGGGYTFARLSVGVTVGFGTREKSYWVDCTVWGEKAADRAVDFLRKGSKVFITGEFGVNEWTNQRGEAQFTPTINVSTWEPLDSKADRDKLEGGSSSDNRGANRDDRVNPADKQQAKTGGGGGWGGMDDDLDDDVPF